MKRQRFVTVVREVTPERIARELCVPFEEARRMHAAGLNRSIARVPVTPHPMAVLSRQRRLRREARLDRAREQMARICGE